MDSWCVTVKVKQYSCIMTLTMDSGQCNRASGSSRVQSSMFKVESLDQGHISINAGLQ